MDDAPPSCALPFQPAAIHKVSWTGPDGFGESCEWTGAICIYGCRLAARLPTTRRDPKGSTIWRVPFGWIHPPDGNPFANGVLYWWSWTFGGGTVMRSEEARSHGYVHRFGMGITDLVMGSRIGTYQDPLRNAFAMREAAMEVEQCLDQAQSPQTALLAAATQRRAEMRDRAEAADAEWRAEVRAARNRKVSLADIAQAAGVSYQYIQQVLDGTR